MLYTKRVTLVFLTQFICTLAFVVYCLLILINFVEMFHTNLSQLHRKRVNDSWLQARCKEQEFVHHIRHHIDLCETVERDALTNVYLTAIQMALDGLHLCGSYSCEKILITITESFRLSIYTWIATIGVVVVILPLCPQSASTIHPLHEYNPSIIDILRLNFAMTQLVSSTI